MIFLSNQFHSIVQGDLPISEYCQRVKTLADSLRDVSHSVSEPQLVLNLLRGLNSRYSNTADDIANSTPFPSFAKARSMLALKELRLANEVKVTTDTALVASSPSCGQAGCRHSAPSAPIAAPTGNDGHGHPRRRDKHRRGKQTGSGSSSSRAPTPQGVAPLGQWFCVNPWAALQGTSQWHPPAPSILGQHLQEHTVFAPSQVSPPTAPSWDQAGLIAAMNQAALQGPGNWIMDTGATSHIASNDGMLLSRLPPSHSLVTVGNESTIPVTSLGHSLLRTPASDFVLHNVLIVPSLVHNLLSVR